MKKLALSVVAAVAASVLTLSAQADWLYNGSNLITSQDGWTLKVAVYPTGATSLRITAYSAGSGVLDLSTPCVDANGTKWPIVRLDDWVFQNRSVITEVVFPKELAEAGQGAFNNHGSLTKVSMLECEAELTVSQRCFDNCAKLQEVYFSPNLKSLSHGIFKSNCSSVNKIVFANYPSELNNSWSGSGQNGGNAVLPEYQVRMYVPKTQDGTGWRSTGNMGNLKLWADCTAEEQTEYTSRYGTDELPDALCKNSGKINFPYHSWVFFVEPQEVKSSLTIANNINDANIGNPVPGYGMKDYTVGTAVDCSIDQYAANGNNYYEFVAGVLMRYNSATAGFDPVETNVGTSATITLADATPIKYTWMADLVAVKPKVSADNLNLGTWTRNGQSDFEGGFYRYGSTVSYTATPAEDIEFVRWYVKDGNKHEFYVYDPTVEVTVTNGMELTPWFKTTNLVYRTSSYSEYRVGDGYNSLAVTNESDEAVNELTLGHSVYNSYYGQNASRPNGFNSAVGELNLDLPIDNGRVIVTIGANALSGLSAPHPLEVIVLPTALREIRSKAFQGSTGIKTIVFNSCPTIAADAFAGLPPGAMIFLVSHKDEGWQAVINDPTQFTRWAAMDAEERAAWRAAHPDEKRPLGKHLVSGQYVRYNDYDPGFILLVR